MISALLVFATAPSTALSQSVERVDDGYDVRLESRFSAGRSMGSLIVGSYPGDVEVERAPSRDIVIYENIYVAAESESEARKIAGRIASDIQERSRSLVIRGTGGASAGRVMRIVLPSSMAVRITTSEGNITLSGGTARVELTAGYGDIRVENLESSLNITMGRGEIEVAGVTGQVDIRSGAGNIDLRDVQSEVYVITGAGDIVLRDITGRATATTGGGEIDGRRMDGKVTFNTAGGDISLRYVAGNLELITSGGGIDLDEIIGNVRATTAGGDIEVSQIFGSLKAETLAGDIDVHGIDGDVRAVSIVGDIHVVVGRGSESAGGQTIPFRIDLRAENGDIELSLPPETNADLRIDLGFDGSLETSRFSGVLTWTDTRRSQRDGRIRRAVAVLNQGGGEIELSSGSGSITISDSRR